MRIQNKNKFTDAEYESLKIAYPNFGDIYIKIREFVELNDEAEDKINEIQQELDYLSQLLSELDMRLDEIQVKKDEYREMKNTFDQMIIKDTFFKDKYSLELDKIINTYENTYLELVEKKRKVEELHTHYSVLNEKYTTYLDQLNTSIYNWYHLYTSLSDSEIENILIEQRSWL